MKNAIIIIISTTLLFLCSFNANAQSKMKAQSYAETAALGVQSYISPLSGHSAKAVILDWEYDYAEKEYVIKAKLTWLAMPCIFTEEAKHTLQGYITVNKSGEITNFSPTYLCNTLKSAIICSEVGSELLNAAIDSMDD